MAKKKELAQKDKLPMEKKKEEQSTVVRSWSDLPHDIIILISSKLPSYSFFDIVSMKGVCSTWRIAMRLRTRMPHLQALSSTPWETHRRECGCTDATLSKENDMIKYRIGNKLMISNEHFLFSSQDPRKIKLEENCGIRRRRRIIGSNPNGWLILSDEDKVAYLFHMFLKIRIELPNKVLDNGRKVEYRVRNIGKAVLCADDPIRSKNFIMVMSYYVLHGTKLAFWRYGNSNWTWLGDVEYCIRDIAVCMNTIYAIRYHGSFYLESWDFKRNSTLPEKELSIPLPCSPDYRQSPHLVVSSKDEIFVLTCFFLGYQTYTYTWRIYKLGSNLPITYDHEWFTYSLDSNRQECIRVHSLDGRALFFSFGDSVILPAIDVERLGFKPNSIYHIEKRDDRRTLQTYCLDDSTLKVYDGTYCYMPMGEYQQPPPAGSLALFLLSI